VREQDLQHRHAPGDAGDQPWRVVPVVEGVRVGAESDQQSGDVEPVAGHGEQQRRPLPAVADLQAGPRAQRLRSRVGVARRGGRQEGGSRVGRLGLPSGGQRRQDGALRGGSRPLDGGTGGDEHAHGVHPGPARHCGLERGATRAVHVFDRGAGPQKTSYERGVAPLGGHDQGRPGARRRLRGGARHGGGRGRRGALGLLRGAAGDEDYGGDEQRLAERPHPGPR
jgi:hypothetical protein